MENKDRAAFPFVINNANGQNQFDTGLTKREYFAGLAMQAYISQDDNDECSVEAIAEWSVDNADALIEALEKADEC